MDPLARTERMSGIAAAVGQMAEGVGKLFVEHVALARIELASEARRVGGELVRTAFVTPFLIVGYAFVCAASAYALSARLGLVPSLILVGVTNLALGALGLVVKVGPDGGRP